MCDESLTARSAAWLFEARLRLFPEQNGGRDTRHRARRQQGIPDGIRLQFPRRAESSKWLAPLYEGMNALVPVEHMDEAARDRDRSAVVGRLFSDSSEFRFAVDSSDRNGVYEDLLESVGLYFKMQYSSAGYGDRRIVPGGFPTAGNEIYGCLRRLRERRREQRFDFDVHARFGLDYRPELRRKAVELLQADEALVTCARLERRRYYQYLYEITRSKLCLDLPGNGGFCFRLIDYLAVGSCVVAYPHENEFPEPLTDGQNIVFVEPDLSDLTEVCSYLSSHDAERERIARNAARYFDHHLHRERLAQYYLRKCLAEWSRRTHESSPENRFG